MVKYRFDPSMVEKAVWKLIELAERHRGKSFSIDKYIIIPRGTIVYRGGIYYLIGGFNVLFRQASGIMIDVKGVHEKLATQLELYINGDVIVSPGRPRKDVEEFIKKIIGF